MHNVFIVIKLEYLLEDKNEIKEIIDLKKSRIKSN